MTAMDAKVTMVLLLTPAAALAAIGALALWRAWRRTRLRCLCLGSLALAAQVLAAALFIAYCGAALWFHTISPAGAPITAPVPNVAVSVVLALGCLFVILGTASVVLALLWEYGRAAAWWRAREELPAWTRRGPFQPSSDPLPPLDQTAAPRRLGLTIALIEAGAILCLVVSDHFTVNQLWHGSPLGYMALAAWPCSALVLSALSVTRGTRSGGMPGAGATPAG